VLATFSTTQQMLATGWSCNGLAAAVRSGDLLRPRVGHYCGRATPKDLVRAVRVGGAATATTAARELGLWVPPDPRLHVAVPLNSPRLRDPDDSAIPLGSREDVVVHWTPRMRSSRTSTGVAPLLEVLAHGFESLPPELALALVDSALHERFLRPDQLPALAALLPEGLRPVLAHADGRADSGIESVARYLLVLLGLRVEPHVRLPGIGEVDLLIEGRLIVEADGREWHDGDAFERDRRRDLVAARTRYRTLRFTWRQVLFQWPSVRDAVLAALAT
jgi:hypothetical protein